MSKRKLENWIRKHPLPSAIVIVAVPAVVTFVVAEVVEDELRKTLHTAAVTLVFGGLLGGLLKILLNDFTLSRQKREDAAAFVTNVLSDLKSVYDRVARVRVLIPAHRSAKTYGSEMRDLIQAGVQLRNVMRALDRRTDGLDQNASAEIRGCVKSMEEYLQKLTTEFKDHYKNLSNQQRVYEARTKALLEAQGKDAKVDTVFAEENVWKELEALEHLKDFISEDETTRYKKEFETPLDAASGELRKELRRILSGETADKPAGTDSTEDT